eukprot:398486-Pelagomonas_calceolata.AAC.2
MGHMYGEHARSGRFKASDSPLWGNTKREKRVIVLQKQGMFSTERADLGIGASEQHNMINMMFCILYAIRTTDRRSTLGTNSLFNSKSVNPKPESGGVKDVMGKIQVHVVTYHNALKALHKEGRVSQHTWLINPSSGNPAASGK